MGSMRLLLGALIGLIFLCTSAQAQSTTLAIRGTWIVDVTDGSLHPDQTVLIQGNRIVAIGPVTTIAVPEDAEIVEAAGGYLIPGLWDMHVHAARAGRAPRFWPLFAAHGVTGVREMGSFVDSLLHWRAESRRPASLAPRIHWSVPALGRWDDAPALPEPDTEATAALVDFWRQHDFDFIKVGSELSRELYFALIERARQQGIPVIGHIPRSVTAIEASDAGQKSVEHVTELIIPCTAGASALGLALADAAARYGVASDSARAAEQRLAGALAFGEPDPAECGPLLERMVANETWLTPTLTLFKGETQPSSFDGDPRLRWVPASSAERWRTRRRLTPELEAQVGGRIMANALKAVTIAHRAGVGILAGTDAGDDAYIFAGSSLHDELALLVAAGLTPLEALQAATHNPARFLQRTDDLGTVSAGKLADLVLLEANPLEDIANVRRIRAVIADGRLYRAADLERLIADVERAVAAAMPTPGHENGTAFDKIATHDNQIATHDNVRPAGRLQDGVLALALWAGAGDWYPEGERSRPRRVAALGEEGGPLSIPSPLVRVPEGTVVHAAIRNTFSTPLRVHGFCDRTDACEAVTVPAGETTNVRFALRDAGTFHYWATTADRSLTMREDDSQLGGAIVVEPPGADVLDRVFVLGMLEEESGGSITEFTVITGRSWPHTERLEYSVGDTVRWRLANLTAVPHALHLSWLLLPYRERRQRRAGYALLRHRSASGGHRAGDAGRDDRAVLDPRTSGQLAVPLPHARSHAPGPARRGCETARPAWLRSTSSPRSSR